MKRWLRCGMVLPMLTGSLVHAQDVEWRAVGAKPKPVIVLTQGEAPPPKPMPPAQAEPLTSPPTATTEKLATPQTATSPIMSPGPVTCLPAPADVGCCDSGATSSTGFLAGPVLFWGEGSTDGYRAWVRGEFLLWAIKGQGGPPLLTTSTTPIPFVVNQQGQQVAQPNNLGALGQPTTVTLLNASDLDNQLRAGGRFSAGYWFDPCQLRGIDASVFFTGPRKATYVASDADADRLFRPFFAVNPGIGVLPGGQPGEYREIVFAKELGVTGRFAAEQRSFFWGADINYRRKICCGCEWNADAFVGFRYLNLDEALTMTESVNFNRDFQVQDSNGNPLGLIPAGSRAFVSDKFSTRNDFYGGQIGSNIRWQRDRWSLDMRPVLAMGVTRQRLEIEGFQAVTLRGQQTQYFNGGLYAIPGNLGTFSSSKFAVVPEITLTVGYQVTEHLRAFAGYNFLYWSSVIRPAEQIDRNIDINRIPNFERAGAVNGVFPRPLFDQNDFWAQGLTLGAEYRW